MSALKCSFDLKQVLSKTGCILPVHKHNSYNLVTITPSEVWATLIHPVSDRIDGYGKKGWDMSFSSENLVTLSTRIDISPFGFATKMELYTHILQHLLTTSWSVITKRDRSKVCYIHVRATSISMRGCCNTPANRGQRAPV